MKYGYSTREDEWKTELYSVPRNGLIKLEILPPNQDGINFLNMRAIYQGQVYYLDRTDAAQSPSGNYIQAILVTQNPKVLENVEVEVNATEELNHLVYMVLLF